MRVLIFGDSHASKSYVTRIVEAAESFECDALFQVGDFGYWPRSERGRAFLDVVEDLASRKPIYWLDGNHEDFLMLKRDHDALSERDSFIEIRDNVFYSPRAHAFEWDGVRFMTVGGAMSIDKDWRVPGESWFEEEEITDDDVVAAAERGHVDVIMSHDAPLGVGIPYIIPGFRRLPGFHRNPGKLQQIVDACTPSLLIHGHYHYPHSTRMERTKVVGLPHNYWDRFGETFTILDTKDFR